MGRQSVLSRSHTPTQSTMTKWSLARVAGVHAAQVVGVDDAHAAALHLLEEAAALHAAHEDDDLHRLDVGAGGDHVHGDGDARVVAVAEGLDQVLGRVAGGAVGDLLGELVALAELLAQDLDDVLGVVVVLGEDQGLGHFGAAGEDVGAASLSRKVRTMVRIWSGVCTSRSSWSGS